MASNHLGSSDNLGHVVSVRGVNSAPNLFFLLRLLNHMIDSLTPDILLGKAFRIEDTHHVVGSVRCYHLHQVGDV